MEQPASTETKPLIKPIYCKNHPTDKVQRIDVNSLEKNPLKCFECLVSTDSKVKIIKDDLVTIPNFMEQLAKLYYFVKNFSTLADSLPDEFTECFKEEEEALKRLREHIDLEKEKVEIAFTMILKDFEAITNKKKQDLLDKLENQYTNLSSNFKYYQEKLDKYFGNSQDVTYPDKEELCHKLNTCKNYDEADQYIKTIRDDMFEINTYGKDPETRSRELKEALSEFSKELVKSCKVLPISNFSTNEKANEMKEELQTTVKPFFEKLLEVSNPIDSMSLSETGKIGSLIVTKIDDIKLLKSWFGGGMVKFKLLYRGTKDGFTPEAFRAKCGDAKPTLTICRSAEHKKVFGGYSDMDWTATGNYKNTANSWLFSLDAREKYNQKPNQTGYAVYSLSTFMPTWGGGHDLYLASNCNSNTSSYSNYGYSYETKSGITYSTTQAQNHLAGAYNFKLEECEIFQVITK